MSGQKEFSVLIPDEHYQIIEFERDELPAVGVINSSLIGFEPKTVFSWHCSIFIEFNDHLENGMPVREDVLKAEKLEDMLDLNIKGDDKEKPNALFLGRVTWNKSRELMWRVFDPELTNNYLSELIDKEGHQLMLSYQIEHDEDWKLVEWYLSSVKI